jgi:hypothetical protein
MPTQAELALAELRPLLEAHVVGIKWAIGATEPARVVAPPRVAWVEGDAQFSYARVGAGAPPDRQRAIWTRHRGLEATIVGVDAEDAERIADEILRAFQDRYPGAYRPVDETTESRQGADNARLGNHRVLRLVLDLAVLGRPVTHARIDAVDIVPNPNAAAGDGNLDAGEI